MAARAKLKIVHPVAARAKLKTVHPVAAPAKLKTVIHAAAPATATRSRVNTTPTAAADNRLINPAVRKGSRKSSASFTCFLSKHTFSSL